MNPNILLLENSYIQDSAVWSSLQVKNLWVTWGHIVGIVDVGNNRDCRWEAAEKASGEFQRSAAC